MFGPVDIERLAARYRRYALRPVEIFSSYRRSDLRPDLMAGLTVAVVAVPQSIAYASIAGLPPAYGLYTACIAAIVGSLWGSSRYLSTGPTNAISILVLSVLAPLAAVGSAGFLLAASTLSVLAGVFCILFGLAGFGMLVNFASRAVLLGFTAGAGVLIAGGQLRHLLRLDIARSTSLLETVVSLATRLSETHWVSVAFGVGMVAGTLLLNRFSKRFPGSLVALVLSAILVALFGAERLGVLVVGQVSRGLPGPTPLAGGGLMEGQLIGSLATGALAVAALGLLEAVSIAREISRQSGERLDANQEFIGQGMANIASGLLGGYACSGSFTRSVVNFHSGASTPVAGVALGLLVLLALLVAGPYVSYVPRAALAGLVLLIAYKMVDFVAIRRVLRTSRSETVILLATFLATLIFPLEFAVLSGIMLSLGIHIYKESMPSVQAVVPDETYRHLVERADAPACPQLGVINIRGTLFFGAVAHVEDVLLRNVTENPGQHLLLLRMHGVDRCDLTGIETLESIVAHYRKLGGDVFMVQVRRPVRTLMRYSGFERYLGSDHFLTQEEAIDTLFAEHLDPAICCYECEHRVFAECQALNKHPYDARLPSFASVRPRPEQLLSVSEMETALAAAGSRALLLDVREPEEYRGGHLHSARSLPLRQVIEQAHEFPRDRPIFLCCRSGRRGSRALHWLADLGYSEVYLLKGGILSWKARGRPIEMD